MLKTSLYVCYGLAQPLTTPAISPPVVKRSKIKRSRLYAEAFRKSSDLNLLQPEHLIRSKGKAGDCRQRPIVKQVEPARVFGKGHLDDFSGNVVQRDGACR